MKITASILATAAALLFSAGAGACSCGGWSYAQQGAQHKETIVAKVHTVEWQGDGTAKLKIDKVLKGSLDQSEVNVLGQDGFNCNGDMVSEIGVPWVVLFSKTDKGYQTLSCAETAVPVEAQSGKVVVKIQGDETAKLTEEEFEKFIRFETRPSVTGLRCAVYARRSYVNPKGHKPNPLNMEYNEMFESSDGNLELKGSKDLSASGEKLGVISFEAFANDLGNSKYRLGVGVIDPFFGRETWMVSEVDLRQTYDAEIADFNRYTSVDGGEMKGGDEPFLAYSAQGVCSLKIGLPLVPVN